jgi:hypothetical protein
VVGDEAVPDPAPDLVVGVRERKVVRGVEGVQEDLGDRRCVVVARSPDLDHALSGPAR